ncbi:hypothetical protein BIW11_07279, partial [Tropilaelaps mercedesae]
MRDHRENDDGVQHRGARCIELAGVEELYDQQFDESSYEVVDNAPLIGEGYDCVETSSGHVMHSPLVQPRREEMIDSSREQLQNDFNQDFTHSSSNSYIRYGTNLVQQVPHHFDQVSTSGVLRFCRTRVLRSYCRLLAAVGWKPLLDDGAIRLNLLRKVVNIAYVLAITGLILVGHVLTVTAYYRRDAMTNTRCRRFRLAALSSGEPERCSLYLFSVFVLPATLHSIAFLLMLVRMRSQDSEEFTALVER